MNNNKLHYYLTHGLKAQESHSKKIGTISNWYDIDTDEDTSKMSIGYNNSEHLWMFTPILYPLSCLTDPIIHEGKEEIPLVELAKIEGCINMGIEFRVKNGRIMIEETCIEFGFDLTDNSFYKRIDDAPAHVCYQLLLFDYLYSRRINVWNIEAIDPRTLEVNPYKN